MIRSAWRRVALAAFGMLALLSGSHALAAPAACAAVAGCSENASFVVEVADLRTSTSGRYRVVTATLRFRNKLTRPLILGYVNGSGVITDDQGNRYVIGGNGVRGIGVLGGNNVDTKFTLDPGESSEARLEFVWEPGHAIVGTRYDMDLTVREVDAVTGNQYRLGRERVLHFADAGKPAGAARAPALAMPNAGSGAAPASASITPVPPATDACAGVARCVSAGPFTAQITSVTPQGGPKDRHHVLALNLRFRNAGRDPIVLAYKAGTSGATDNYGNAYYYGRANTHDTSSAGIGLVTSNEANASFVLAPGATRDASFKVIRFDSVGKPLGTGWVYDVVISQLEILPSQQVRVLRDYSLHFTDVTASGVGAAAGSVDDAVQGLKDLFKKKK